MTDIDTSQSAKELPPGAVVEYVDVVAAHPDSQAKGPFLMSKRGNYFAASGTDYQA